MKIILDTSSTNPEYNGECDYAVVDLTPTLLRQLRRRVELVQKAGETDGDLYESYFWGGTADFYDRSLIDACQEAIARDAERAGQDETTLIGDWMADLEVNGHVLLPLGVDLSEHEVQRTECDQLIVRRHLVGNEVPFEVGWIASPRHTDIYVTTRDLEWEDLEAYAQGRQPVRMGV